MKIRTTCFTVAAVAAASFFFTAANGAGTEGRAEGQPVLKTQQFENGELQLAKVDAQRLEEFLRDLNRRRDYDLSQHNGKPGPDHDYLTRWRDDVTDELLDRGYYFDKRGELHRPGEIIPTR